MQEWNRERTRTLLRYGRKQCGPWDWDESDDPKWREGELPDDGDVDLVVAAPEMKQLLVEIYDGIHKGQGRFGSASDGEIAEAINDKMCDLIGNDWHAVQ